MVSLIQRFSNIYDKLVECQCPVSKCSCCIRTYLMLWFRWRIVINTFNKIWTCVWYMVASINSQGFWHTLRFFKVQFLQRTINIIVNRECNFWLLLYIFKSIYIFWSHLSCLYLFCLNSNEVILLIYDYNSFDKGELIWSSM